MIDFSDRRQIQQLTAFYQPIVELETGKIVRLEARARWQEYRSHLVEAAAILNAAKNPQDFLILDRAILDEVAELLRRSEHESHQLNVPIAVNISVAVSADEGLSDQYQKHLKKLKSVRTLSGSSCRKGHSNERQSLPPRLQPALQKQATRSRLIMSTLRALTSLTALSCH
jgi:hypothetical protein